MEPPIRVHLDRCDLCGGDPACVPACPQQVLAIGDQRVIMTHTDRCPEGCTVCVEVCPPHVFSLVEEVHSDLGIVPVERVEGSARVHHVAYRRDEDEAEEDIRERFMLLCVELGIPEGQRSIGETRAHAWGELPKDPTVSLQLAWELHTEYYFVRAILSHDGELPESAYMEAIVPALHRAGTPPLVTCLDMLVVDHPMDPEEVCQHIICRNRFGARVMGGDLAVYTNYEPLDGRERYVIAGSRQAIREHAAFAVANIGRIENYYHLLLLPRNEVRNAVQEVHRWERDLSRRLQDVTHALEGAEPAHLEEWLRALTVDLSRVVRLHGRYNHVLSATFPYSETVRDGFAAWKEEPVKGFDSLSEVILNRTSTVSEEYHAFLARLDRMENEISDLVAILRTRVDMNMEAQNTKLLRNLDIRSAIQTRLQEMAEGLSVIVISYYMTGLAGYVFKALEKRHVIESATVPTALFIPVAVLTAFLVARRGMSKLRKKERQLHQTRD